ncbi:thioredoxin family protein [Brumimicrobium mesophilum]|uniref:thioredoxin family protein n=1 Tax=Brumimicrobium mesophilum TaxID=392717 RepID=UPI001F36EF3D|nr:thioredoxin family protein [Brumimicrobium mesophilum]
MENTINFKEYLARFDDILAHETPPPPYNDSAYLDYLKLNRSRQKRWLKTASIRSDLRTIIERIDTKQTWYLITEPWCGDAAHNNPFIFLMSELNPNITLKIVLRDAPPFMIDGYLTNGGKAIPKLIIRDSSEKDLHVWGPRPVNCQLLFNKLKEEEADFERQKVELQNWYNIDKGVSLQDEFIHFMK